MNTMPAGNDPAWVAFTYTERAAFEKWVLGFCNASLSGLVTASGHKLYADPVVQNYWWAWIARANLRAGLLRDPVGSAVSSRQELRDDGPDPLSQALNEGDGVYRP